MQSARFSSMLDPCGRECLWSNISGLAGYGSATTFTARVFPQATNFVAQLLVLGRLLCNRFLPRDSVNIYRYSAYSVAAAIVMCFALWACKIWVRRSFATRQNLASPGPCLISSGGDSILNGCADLSCSSDAEGDEDANDDEGAFVGSRPTCSASIVWTYTSGTSIGFASAEASGSGLSIEEKRDAVLCGGILDTRLDNTVDNPGERSSGSSAQGCIAEVATDTQAISLQGSLDSVTGEMKRTNDHLEALDVVVDDLTRELAATRRETAQAHKSSGMAQKEFHNVSRRMHQLEANITTLDRAHKVAEEGFRREKTALEISLSRLARDADAAISNLGNALFYAREESTHRGQLAEKLQKRMEHIESKHQRMFQHLQHEKQSIENALKRVHAELAANASAVSKQGSVIEKLGAEITRVKSERDAELFERSLRIKMLQNELDEKTSEISLSRVALDFVDQELAEVNRCYAELKYTQGQEGTVDGARETALCQAETRVEALESARRSVSLRILALTLSREELLEQLGVLESRRTSGAWDYTALRKRVSTD